MAISSGVSTVGGVVVTVLVVRSASTRGHRANDWVESKDPLVRARALLDSGLIDTRTDLGVELGLLVSDPDAFMRVTDEAEGSAGPAISALADAARLPVDLLAEHWLGTRAVLGDVASAEDADRFVVQFLSRIARDLRVDPVLGGEFLWDLARERARPGFPQDAPTHRWLANWMGVRRDHAVKATEAALGGAHDGVVEVARGDLFADPERFLDRISGHIGKKHARQVTIRIRSLSAGVQPWMPQPPPPQDKP